MEIRYRNTEGQEVVMGQEPPFLVTAKEGFAAVENQLTTQTQYGLDGALLIHQQLGVRSLDIKGEIVAHTAKELSDMRLMLSSIFNPQLAGTLYYCDFNKTYSIDVVIEQAPVMDESPVNLSTEFTLSLKALDPYWADITKYNSLISLSGLHNNFKFPFVITDNFTFANIESGVITKVTNSGDVPVGGIFTMRVNAQATNIKVVNILTQEVFEFLGTYEAGTVLTVNTKRGEKQVTKTVDGVTTNAMSERSDNSVFLQMAKGDNFIQIQADTGQSNITTEFQFTPLVMGV